MTTSREMAELFSGDPGFWDVLRGIGTKVLRGAVKGIPFIGGIASEFIDPAIDLLTGAEDVDERDTDEFDEED